MDFVQKKSVIIYANPEFLIIKTLSGYRRLAVDPNAKIHQLLPTANPSEIGACVLNALAASRLINIDDAPVFLNRDLTYAALRRLDCRFVSEIWLFIKTCFV